MSTDLQLSSTETAETVRGGNHIFDRCGLASVVDLHSGQWEELFRLMTVEQESFLVYESRFRSPAYIWPRDALNKWSRVWEYPYAYYHLRNWRESKQEEGCLTLIDYSSGVTFFPFTLTKLNYNAICVDIDPVCVKDVAKAAGYVPHGPGKITSCLLEGSQVPLESHSIDGLYCVSVLEHVPQFEVTIDEMYRVIKPGGLLVLTIDLGLAPPDEICASRFRDLINALKIKFNFVFPETTIHPNDLLSTSNSKFPMRSLSHLGLGIHMLKQMVKAIIGRQPRWQPRPNLAVMGMVLRKP